MDIRKTDAKGRLSLGETDRHFFVVSKDSGEFVLRPVPTLPEGSEMDDYDRESVTEAKDAVWNLLDDLKQEGALDEGFDSIGLADRVVRSMVSLGWKHPDDFPPLRVTLGSGEHVTSETRVMKESQ